MTKSKQQTFDDFATTKWTPFDGLPGVSVVFLAEPVAEGSIHRARLSEGTVIPTHTHPVDEYVYVVSGVIDTGGRRCEAGTFWMTPANLKQGPHHAITDTEILTIRMGPLGPFD